jgi:ABC-2 type transport system permease protein
MNSVWPIVKKEFRSFFNSPIAYIAVVFFVVFTAVWFFFIQNFFARNTASLRAFFEVMPGVFTVLIPAITMRMWAEERKLGTVEILATLPFSEWTLVIGKFLAAFFLVCIMLVLTLPVPLFAGLFGRFDAGQVVSEYLGVLLMSATAVAIGAFISSLTKNQISAFIFSALLLLALWLAQKVSFLSWASLSYHFESFNKGVLDSRDLLFFVIVGAGALFLTAKTIVFRKWR